MFDNDVVGKFQVEQWIPPYIVEKIKNGPTEWIHLVTQASVPKEEAGCVVFNYMEGCRPEFFINGELMPDEFDGLREVESRLQTGL